MSRISATPQSLAMRPHAGVRAAARAEPGAGRSMMALAHVGGPEAGAFFGHQFGTTEYRLAFERAAVDAAELPPEILVHLFDADFAPDAHGQTNRSAVREALMAAMDMLAEAEPHAYASAADRFAEIIVQPSPTRDTTAAIEQRLANWTQGLDAPQKQAIERSVMFKQAALLNDAGDGTQPSLLDKAPPVHTAVAQMLARAGANSWR